MSWRWALVGVVGLLVIYQYSSPSSGPKVGAEAPPIKVATLAGEEFDLASTRGQVVVLDFWATWCGPCKRSLPALQAVHEAYAEDESVAIYSVNTDISAAQGAGLNKWMARQKWDFPVLLDAPRNAVAQRYRVQSIPTVVIIGPSGKVHHVSVGLPAPNTAGIKAHLEAKIESARGG